MRRVLVTGGSGFIGVNLIEHLSECGFEVANYDTKPPRNRSCRAQYYQGDIRDERQLTKAVKDLRPELIVHLAARCDLAGESLADYSANTVGVSNVIAVVRSAGSVERILFASSRYVHSNEHQPKSDVEYSPFTMYGQSKVESERIVRDSRLETPWAIVRPTSIWGPWFDAPYKGFFDAVRKGLYVHPKGEKILKSFGYVGNIAYQIRRLLETPQAQIEGQVFYLADYKPIDVREMADTIRKYFEAPPVRDVPIFVMKSVALVGDALRWAGWSNPPLTSFRLGNLRAQMVYDLSRTESVVGPTPFTMERGIEGTVNWMLGQSGRV